MPSMAVYPRLYGSSGCTSRFVNYNAVSPLRNVTALDFHEHEANERAHHGREETVFANPLMAPHGPGLALRKGYTVSLSIRRVDPVTSLALFGRRARHGRRRREVTVIII